MSAHRLTVALRDLLANAEAKELYIRDLENKCSGEETPAELDSPEMARARAVLAEMDAT